MKHGKIFAGILCAALLAGCSKEAEPFGPPYVASDQSISSYIAPKQAETNITYRHEANGQAGDGQARYDQMQVEFYAGGIYPQAEEPYLVQFVTRTKNAPVYDSLTKAHQDYGYGYDPAASAHDVLYNGLKSVDIVSDQDYDPAHPAGTSLADIFSLSVQKVVKGTVDGHPGYVFQQKDYSTVQALAGDEPHLLARVFVLKPTRAPEVTREHVFTVTYEDENGRMLTAQTKAFKILAR